MVVCQFTLLKGEHSVQKEMHTLSFYYIYIKCIFSLSVFIIILALSVTVQFR